MIQIQAKDSLALALNHYYKHFNDQLWDQLALALLNVESVFFVSTQNDCV